MLLVIADCSVDSTGRLDAHLPRARRLLMLKADGSVLVHPDGGSYKPLNWMTAPCVLTEREPDEDESELGVVAVWTVQPKKMDGALLIRIYEKIAEVVEELGEAPGLGKDGVEANLQELLAEQVSTILGRGGRLQRLEHQRPLGPFA